MCAEQHLWYAAAAPGGAAKAENTLSETGTEGNSAAVTEAAVMQAQHAQREAMLASQDSLNGSRDRLLDVREALQQFREVATGA